jgi:hypothetical protein
MASPVRSLFDFSVLRAEAGADPGSVSAVHGRRVQLGNSNLQSL